ncbi:MAG TPA: MarR family transcriptional regulator [Limnochordia bacterium]|nr:MarR family transcriptional regulator [Limnochordia bacterium]
MDKLVRVDENLNRLMRHLRAELVRGLDISPSQFFVLHLLDRKETPTMGDLAAYLGCSLSAATAIIDRLVDAGFVERNRDTDDRRVVRIQLTGSGVALLERSRLARRRVLKDHFDRLDPHDFDRFCEIIERLTEATFGPDAGPT